MEIKEFLEIQSNENLIKSYGLIIEELKKREIIHSKNVLGDLGEYLVIKHYCDTPGLPNLQKAPSGTQNVDALSKNGERYSIKSTTSNTTSVFYGLNEPKSNLSDKQKFEHVAIAIFDKNFFLKRINELTWEEFLKYKRWHSRMRAWNLAVTKELLDNTKTIYLANIGNT